MRLLRRVSSLFGGRVDIEKRFELLREAVHGTMSQFYMARDRSSGQIVGLKILDPEKTRQFEKRFEGIDKPAEGPIASSLDHPSIVKTMEYGLTTEGRQYLVMEYLEGQGLNTLIMDRNTDLVGHRFGLLRQAAQATAAVHRAGYIHRDICPRNFVVSSDLSTLKLIDFGLTVPDTSVFRQPGNRTGTPKYMSPEVVRRRATDHRLDIFSYGVTAYELYCYETPWPTSVATGKAAMEHTKPPTPITVHCSNIDPLLAELIHDCLASEADERPGTMQKVLERVDSVSGAGSP